ncbi:VOC family protein [Sphingomonas sp. 1P06PA]|uniref:VOC family protein n=1 Tax=Sphingomonas sp. 1P06PA TaxID=554121 RepID=UPI0039A52585
MTVDRTLFQQAYFVNSIDEAAQRWSDAFGAGPFYMVRHHKTDEFSYRGQEVEADVSYAFGYLGDTMIQFIQQHDDQPSIYRDMYAAGEEGFHHIAYLVSDFASERQRWIDMGYPLATELYADGVNAAYFDTRTLNGGFTEIHGDPMHIMGLFALWKRAHVARDADTPAMIELDGIVDYQRAPMMPLHEDVTA